VLHIGGASESKMDALYIKYLIQVIIKNHNKYQPNLAMVAVNIDKIKIDDNIIKGE
jgi:hypothetical protein